MEQTKPNLPSKEGLPHVSKETSSLGDLILTKKQEILYVIDCTTSFSMEELEWAVFTLG